MGTFSIVFGVCYRNRKAIFGWNRRCQQNAIVALCSYQGFISEHHPDIKLERHAERPFLTLTNASDLLQMAIVRSLNVLCIRIFLKFASEDNDCGNGMKGQDSVLRTCSLSSPETFGF